MKKQTIDIKSLTAELKSMKHGGPKTVVTDNQREKEKKNLHRDRSDRLTEKKSGKDNLENNQYAEKLYQIIKNVNSKDHYKVDRFVYVDEDIHEVFIKLKAQTRLKISHLVSSLLEEFINEHKDAIVEIITKKQNKFLDG